MKLAHYINDLLYRNDCVIIPNFGGFITNKISASLDSNTQMLYPPTKQITFNALLTNNDGLLANYIASVENISFEQANEKIANLVASWQTELENGAINIASIGNLCLNEERQLIFEPNVELNLLTESFGLYKTKSLKIKRFDVQIDEEQLVDIRNIEIEETTEEKEIEEELVVDVEQDRTKKGKVIPLFVKPAAVASVLLALGFIGYSAMNKRKQDEIFAKKQQDIQQKIEQKIQQATFVIETPLPTITLNLEKEEKEEVITEKKYVIVAGAFRLRENADKKLRKLKANGFKNAFIIGENKWGLTEVAYTATTDKNEAINQLRNLKKTVSKEAWLLVNKFD